MLTPQRLPRTRPSAQTDFPREDAGFPLSSLPGQEDTLFNHEDIATLPHLPDRNHSTAFMTAFDPSLGNMETQ